ncbi:MAG TPA: DNA repair protein RadC [Stellaceae bacterium]|nr:DNA repair protein RadC [Stellaceae bacterium]
MPRKTGAPFKELADAVGIRPHYLGHRQRLHDRLLEAGAESLPDYEILEILLAASNPRGDTKPLAKGLIDHFGGTLAAVLSADPEAVRAVKAEGRSVGSAGIAMLKAVREAALRLSRAQLMHGNVIGSWDKLIDYCKANIAHGTVEEFHLLFLDRKNALIRHERQQRGTIDHTPVYPREVVKRALELNASALILVHNHPSGDPTPSKADIEVTRDIVAAAKPIGVAVHDHLIIGRGRHTSLRDLGLLG